MKKKVYEKPMLTTEEFVPNEYVAVCPPGEYIKGQQGKIQPSWHGWIDSGPNKVSDKHYDKAYDNVQITSNNSGKEPEPGTPGIWIWDQSGTQLYIAYQLQNDKQYVFYETTYIPKNNS